MSLTTEERMIYDSRVKASRDLLTMQETMEGLRGSVGQLQGQVGQLQASLENEKQVSRRLEIEMKFAFIGRIQLCERLLKRAVSDADSLLDRSLDELRTDAERIEGEVTRE